MIELRVWFEKLRRIPARVRVFIASLHIPDRMRRVRDDIRFLFLGRYLSVRYAARLAYEYTETNDVGSFVYDFSKGEPEKVLDYYIYWMMADCEIYGRVEPSKQWRPLGLRQRYILSGTNSAYIPHTPPLVFKHLRVSRRDFAKFIRSMDKMVRV